MTKFGVSSGTRTFPARCKKVHLLTPTSAAVAFIFFTVLVLILDILQITLWIRNALYPSTFAALTIFQAAFWAIVLSMDIISIAASQQSSQAIGLVVILL